MDRVLTQARVSSFWSYYFGYIVPEPSLGHTTHLVLNYLWILFCTPISLFLGNPIQIGPIDNNKSPLSSPVLTKKLENTLDRIEDAFKSLPDRPRSASIGNMKKFNSPDLITPHNFRFCAWQKAPEKCLKICYIFGIENSTYLFQAYVKFCSNFGQFHQT